MAGAVRSTGPTPLGQRALALVLVAAAYALALWQRPGESTSDTKIDLHVDPGGFLADVASVWTSQGALGHVQGGQYGGYLWPMGPFFALGHALGLEPWLVQRLWLGTVLALAAYGTLRLLDELLGRPRGVAHAVAGALVVLNPYVVVFTNRTSITLLAYAALPWLLLAVHRGLAEPRRWLWPAAFALVLTSAGGGVNAAVIGWMLLGPLLLVVYEPLVGAVSWRAVRGFAWRAALAAGVVSAWWVAPLAVQTLYGIDFLAFTEQPGTIWGTTSIPESLRLMGYWPSYIAVGYGGRPIPYFESSDTMLFAVPVLVASLLVPALALLGYTWTRRWRYGPFFLLMAVAGLVVMIAGFPPETLLRRAVTFTYYRLEATQFLRTTYKAGPLLALAVACLGGAAAGEAWRRLSGRVPAGRRAALGGALAALAAVVLVAQTWPVSSGRGIDSQVTWDRIPPAWTQAADDLERELPANRRALVLPGQLFAFYRWGGTVDPILPALTSRPVAVRSIVPYADLHAIDLMWTTDGLVQQRRLLPGQLRPLLGLMSVGAVLSATDDDRARSGALQPAEAARQLATEQALGAPARRYGPTARFPAEPGKPGAPVALPQVRRYDVPGSLGLVRVAPTSPETVVDGSAATLAGLAAFDGLRGGSPLFYAADREPADLRAAAERGAEVVVGDGNRRRAFIASRPSQNVGWTIGADDELSADAPVLDPFAAEGHGADGQTVQVLDGARHVTAPASPGFSQFPERRPFAAVDGDPDTFWLADAALEDHRHYMDIGFAAPRDVPWVGVVPYGDERGVVTAVAVNGRRFAVRPGLNRLPVGLRDVRDVRVAIAEMRVPPRYDGVERPAGGLREVVVPGVRIREALRPPVLAERALAGADLRRTALTYLFERTTGDDPFRRGTVTGPAQAAQVRDALDGETRIARRIAPPAARAYDVQAWATVSPEAPDSALDHLAGARGPERFEGSSRWLGRPGWRASRAFDGDPARPWIAGWVPGERAWLSWSTPREAIVRELRLAPPPVRVATPATVRLIAAGRPGAGRPVARGPLRVGPGGRVGLPRALRGRTFRLEVLSVRVPSGYAASRRRAVGIGELSGDGVPRSRVPVRGPLRAGCGSARLASRPAGGSEARPAAVGLRVAADVARFDRGAPLRAAGCGPLRLPAGPQTLVTSEAPFRLDLLRLRSAPPAGAPATAGGGRVVDPGEEGRGRREGVRVALDGQSWLVLGESYNRGWRAECDGRSLGEPQVIDVFANGWRAPADCRAVTFTFAPNRMVTAGFAISAVAGLALLAVLLAGLWRDRRRRRAAAPPAAATEAAAPASLALRWPLLPAADAPRRWPLRRALVAGAAATLVVAFCFGLPAAAIAGPALVVVLHRGVGARPLILAAGALLAVVVPLLYVALPVHDRNGQNFGYAVERAEANLVGALALLLLVAELARTLLAARAGTRRAARRPLRLNGSRSGNGAGRESPSPRRAT